MAAATATAAFSLLPLQSSRISTQSKPPSIISTVHSNTSRFPHPIRSSRRISHYTVYTQEGSLIGGSRYRGDFDGEDDADSSDEDDDRSLDLLIRFLQNMFRKISRRARRAVRSVLPVLISPRLVRFSVNGVLALASLWVVKAFLEVVCTLGTIVFVTILLIRALWSGISYLQESRNSMINRIDDENSAWTGAQPAT